MNLSNFFDNYAEIGNTVLIAIIRKLISLLPNVHIKVDREASDE